MEESVCVRMKYLKEDGNGGEGGSRDSLWVFLVDSTGIGKLNFQITVKPCAMVPKRGGRKPNRS